MNLKVIHTVHFLYNHLEQIIGGTMFFFLHINVNWTDKIIGALVSFAFSMLTAGLVSLFKKYKVSEKIMKLIKKNGNKKDNNTPIS